ncbi:hypothetical protein IAT38_005265 [Cryptococcus sp. DSM 104549]
MSTTSSMPLPSTAAHPHILGLPTDILYMIFKEVYHHEDGGGQRKLRKCLGVHSTFYFNAAPIVYAQPTVYDLGTFFLGADNPVPPHIFAMPPGKEVDVLCIQHGNTKLPLLRHLRRLSACPKQLKEEEGGRPTNFVRSLVQARDVLQSLQKTLPPEAASQILPRFTSIALGPALPWQYRIPNTNVQTEFLSEMWHGLNILLLPLLFSTGAHRKQVCYDDYHKYASPRKAEWLDRARGVIPTTVYRHTQFPKKHYGDGPRRWRIVWGVANKVYVDFARYASAWTVPYNGRRVMGPMSQEAALDHLCHSFPNILSWPGQENSERDEIALATSVEVYGLEQVIAFDRGALPELDALEMELLDWEEAVWTSDEEQESKRKERKQASQDLMRLEKLLFSMTEALYYGGTWCPYPRIRLLRRDQAPPCPCCGYSPMTEKEYDEETGSDRSWDYRGREVDDDFFD